MEGSQLSYGMTLIQTMIVTNLWALGTMPLLTAQAMCLSESHITTVSQFLNQRNRLAKFLT